MNLKNMLHIDESHHKKYDMKNEKNITKIQQRLMLC